MMKYFSAIIIMLLFTNTTNAQNLQISVETGGSAQSFVLNEGTAVQSGTSLTITGSRSSRNTIANVITWDVSPLRNRITTARGNGKVQIQLLTAQSDELLMKQMEFLDATDSSLKIYSFDNGMFIIRDNIANFSFYAADGKQKYSVQNLSGSSDGEKISELRSSDDGSTILIYNPEIIYGNKSGSRARIVKTEGETQIIYESGEKVIVNATVSKNGAYIALITSDNAGESDAILFDRFGNRLFEVSVSDELMGLSISENGNFLTLFSSNRVQLYNTGSGSREASSTIRRSIIHAEYQPTDQQILVYSGDRTGDSNVQVSEFYSIHVGQRQIARSEISTPFQIFPGQRFLFERLASNRYAFLGLSKPIEIRTDF